MKRFYLFLLFAYISCMSCKSDFEPEDNTLEVEGELPVSDKIKDEKMVAVNYVEWVRNPVNGLVKTKIIDDLEYKVQYKPVSYIISLEEGTDAMTDSLLGLKSEELEGNYYFDLTISLKDAQRELLKAGIESAADYDRRVDYLAFKMQNDIQLVDGKDTLPCVMYHFERAFDVSPACSILLGFEKRPVNLGESKTLLVYDRIFNKGLLKFTFKHNRLQTLPKLITL